jgi:hypothetical protein
VKSFRQISALGPTICLIIFNAVSSYVQGLGPK